MFVKAWECLCWFGSVCLGVGVRVLVWECLCRCRSVCESVGVFVKE